LRLVAIYGHPIMNKLFIMTALSTVLSVSAISATAQSKREAPTTPATHHHGLPNNNPGFNGGSANSQGVGKNGGGNIHGIANVPGQNSDNHPQNGQPGFKDQLGDVHGGLGGGH